MQLRFAHRSLETKQKPIVEVGRVVDTVFIEDQRVGQRADLKQSVPIRVVAGESRDLQPHHDPCASQPHVSYELAKAFPASRRGARLTLVGVDHDDALVSPAQSGRTSTQSILALGALDVLEHLLHRRLTDVEISITLEMMRQDFASV